MTLLETQVFQAMLSNVGSISYTGAILTATLHMLRLNYLCNIDINQNSV